MSEQTSKQSGVDTDLDGVGSGSILEQVLEEEAREHPVRSPRRRGKPTDKLIGVALALAGAVGGVALARADFGPPERMRWSPPGGELASQLEFILLDKEFNRLPVERRIEIILELADRLNSMTAGDSVLLASFAAGIRAEARERLEENVRKLGVDIMSDYARDYSRVDPEDREAFLEDCVVDMVRIMNRLTGDDEERTDDEILDWVREDTDREVKALKERDQGLKTEQVTWFFERAVDDIDRFESANDRARTAKFMVHMMRHFRGRDPQSNEARR